MSNSFVNFFRSIYVYGCFVYICLVIMSTPGSFREQKGGGTPPETIGTDGYEPPIVRVLGIEPDPLEDS